MIVSNIAGPEINKYWPLLDPFFKKFEESTGGNVTADDLKEAVEKSYRHCWIALEPDNFEIKAVGLSEVSGHKKVMYLDYLTGNNREEWLEEAFNKFEEWAKAIGVTEIKVICRKGWVPFLKGEGFRETHRVMEKRL